MPTSLGLQMSMIKDEDANFGRISVARFSSDEWENLEKQNPDFALEILSKSKVKRPSIAADIVQVFEDFLLRIKKESRFSFSGQESEKFEKEMTKEKYRLVKAAEGSHPNVGFIAALFPQYNKKWAEDAYIQNARRVLNTTVMHEPVDDDRDIVLLEKTHEAGRYQMDPVLRKKLEGLIFSATEEEADLALHLIVTNEILGRSFGFPRAWWRSKKQKYDSLEYNFFSPEDAGKIILSHTDAVDEWYGVIWINKTEFSEYVAIQQRKSEEISIARAGGFRDPTEPVTLLDVADNQKFVRLKFWDVWQESNELGHCLAQPSHGYINAMQRGAIQIHSLRRPRPLLTIEVQMYGDQYGFIKQIRGKANRLPGFDYNQPMGDEDLGKIKKDEVDKLFQYITEVIDLDLHDEETQKYGVKDIHELVNAISFMNRNGDKMVRDGILTEETNKWAKMTWKKYLEPRPKSPSKTRAKQKHNPYDGAYEDEDEDDYGDPCAHGQCEGFCRPYRP